MIIFEPNKLLSYDNESIIQELQRVYNTYYKNQRMTIKEFNRYSRVHSHTIKVKFGSWENALKIALGDNVVAIKKENKKQITSDDIENDIKRIIKLNDNNYITYKFYKESGGKYSFETITRRLGYKKWDELLGSKFSLFKIRKVIIKKSVNSNKSSEYSTDELISELRNVWDKLGRRPTYMEFRKLSNIGSKIYEKRFGSWTQAIEQFCLKFPNYESSSFGIGFKATKELLIQELLRIKDENKLENLEQDDLIKFGGKYHFATYHNHFGSWKNAVHAAGLKSGHDAPTIDELFDELQRVWEILGRQPLHNEMKAMSKYTHKSYSHKFGSWTKAIYAFINDRSQGESSTEYISEKTINETETPETFSEENFKNDQNIYMKTTRFPSTRLRFKILLRDNFSCVFCGRNTKNDSSVVLHIDHIIPYSKGGETSFENLQTLCNKCNLGKADS